MFILTKREAYQAVPDVWVCRVNWKVDLLQVGIEVKEIPVSKHQESTSSLPQLPQVTTPMI